jgi:hypothetical protein
MNFVIHSIHKNAKALVIESTLLQIKAVKELNNYFMTSVVICFVILYIPSVSTMLEKKAALQVHS